MSFRFEDLDVWKRSVEVATRLFDLADGIEARKLFRFAEQLRGAALSLPNNISEGSGSTSRSEFVQFLNFARRSAFECANMLMIFEKRGLVSKPERERLVNELDQLCRMITSFSRSLRSSLSALRSLLFALRSLLFALCSLLFAPCRRGCGVL